MRENMQRNGFRSAAAIACVGRRAFAASLLVAMATLMSAGLASAVAPDELQGRWQVVSMDGQTGGFQPGMQFVVRGERWEYVDAPMNIKQKSGTLRVDSSARPKQLDLIAPPDIKAPNRAYAFWVSDGSPVRCLYDVQGDTLTITWRNPGTGQPRPAGMAGDGQFVIEHKRLRQ
jgi:uncharacterized protein (TIGR03067 family)